MVEFSPWGYPRSVFACAITSAMVRVFHTGTDMPAKLGGQS